MQQLANIKIPMLCMGVALMASCSSERSNIPKMNEINSAQEIKTQAGKAASTVVPDEAAETIPVPKRLGEKFVIQILYYRQVGSPGKRKELPPEYCMLLDPESGKVIRFWRCTLAEIGLDEGTPTVAGAGIKSGMTTEEFTMKEERLLAISQPVWIAFFHGGVPNAADTRALVREYRQLFLQTTNEGEAGFTVAAAAEFFQWLDTVAK